MHAHFRMDSRPSVGLSGWLALFCLSLVPSGMLEGAPTISRQPVAATAYETQTATFTVTGTGAGAVGYRWRFSGNEIASATNSTLVLTNLTSSQAGSYSVVLTDSTGSTASEGVLLTVLPRPYPTLRFGTFVTGDAPEIPVQLMAYGGETRVLFTVAFSTNALVNPRFLLDGGEGAGANGGSRGAGLLGEGDIGTSVRTDTSVPGRFGVEVILPVERAMTPGANAVGRVVFDAVVGAGAYAGGVHFTNAPLALEVGSLAGTNSIPASEGIGPVVRVLGAPKLNAQSGLFLQRVEIGNPGIVTQAQVRVTVSGLTNDSLGIPIRLYNSLGTDASGASVVYSAQLSPGEARALGLEYYVADLTTVPTPVFASDEVATIAGPSIASRTLEVDRVQFLTDAVFGGAAFLIEFPTDAGRNYFVQYAPSMEAFTQDTSQIRTARPAIPGTGSRVQWIDHGAPKTDSAPAQGARFYRVILGR
jgi:hypothetical protein